jgi:hypothetical protein
VAWEVITPQAGPPYEINWTGVEIMIRAFARSQAVLDRSETVTKPVKELGPGDGTFSRPVFLTTVDIDWGLVHRLTDVWSWALLEDFRCLAASSMSEAQLRLEKYVTATAGNNSIVARRQARAARRTVEDAQAEIDRLQKMIDIARHIRDMSADAELAFASFLTGGAAYAAVAAGSVLKGVAKYDRTGSVGSGVVTGAIEAAFGVLGILGGAFMKAEGLELLRDKVVFVVILNLTKGSVQAGQAVIEGKSLGETAAMTGWTIANPVARTVVKAVLPQWAAVPINVAIKVSPQLFGPSGPPRHPDSRLTPEERRFASSALQDASAISRTALRPIACE